MTTVPARVLEPAQARFRVVDSPLPDAAFQHDESFYRAVLESLAEGVMITDPNGRIRYANGIAAEITGYAAQELVGARVEQVIDMGKPSPETEEEGSWHACECCHEFELRRKDGHVGWVYLRATPFRTETGVAVGSIIAMSCIQKQKSLELENAALLEEVRESFGSIVGESAELRKVIAQIATVAPTEASVLVLGESGTGKELVARAIHDMSPRKEGPLVRVNCASIPKELFESEFFGHVRGAFTSAVKDRVGRFELADGGTLFLDEVGEIPLDLQSKLLRVLQEGQFERLGDERTRTVNVRIVAATNRDLLAEARAGRFRLDLYYRLSVFPIEVPPLRARGDDIKLLAERFIRDAARRLGISPPRLSRADVRQLEHYDWPGNVRELQNVVERAVILARDGKLRIELPRTEPRPPEAPSASLTLLPVTEPEILSLDDLEERRREIVAAALQRTNGKIYGPDGAAALLKVKPTTLVSMVKRLNLGKPGSRVTRV
jgi:formate hydrogenlyase transcriptional activator